MKLVFILGKPLIKEVETEENIIIVNNFDDDNLGDVQEYVDANMVSCLL